jgi:hypothetical protein
MTTMAALIAGALAAGYAVAGLHFAKFWSRTRDRLFAIFALAFWLLAIQRIAIVVSDRWLEDTTPLYALRLLAFLLILVAIVDKNRQAGR